MEKLFKAVINILLDNKIFYYYLNIKSRFITPQVEKIYGKIAVNKIENKGKDLRIHGKVSIKGHSDLIIGDYVRIGKGAYFDCNGGLTIGDNTQMSRFITIFSNTHDINSSAIPYDQKSIIYRPVVIGNSVWIGQGVVIAPGTIIGDGAVIGMGATISGEIPKGAIVVGPKHRIVGYRNIKDLEEKINESKYFGLIYPDN